MKRTLRDHLFFFSLVWSPTWLSRTTPSRLLNESPILLLAPIERVVPRYRIGNFIPEAELDESVDVPRVHLTRARQRVEPNFSVRQLGNSISKTGNVKSRLILLPSARATGAHESPPSRSIDPSNWCPIAPFVTPSRRFDHSSAREPYVLSAFEGRT